MAVKLDKEKLQSFLLAKGDKLALAVGGGVGGLLLVGGVMAATGNPFSTDPSKKLTSEASRVTTAVGAAGEDAPALPPWTAKKDLGGSQIDPAQFADRGRVFEPVHVPNLLRENPTVKDVLAFQMDVVRFPYKAYDIQDGDDGTKLVGVLKDKTIDKKDIQSYAKAMKDAMDKMNRVPGRPQPRPTTPPPGAVPPGVPGGGMGSGGGPGGRPGPGGGMPGGGMGGGMPGEGMGGGSGMPGMGMAGGQRTDATVEYVHPDRVGKEGLQVAESIAPMRAVMVHGLIPLRDQLDEYQRALKVQPKYKDGKKTYEGVDPVQYAGFDVQRRVTFPDGKTGEWTDYLHAEKYYEEVLARSLRNTAEQGYLSRFFRYEDELVHPLPEVADGLYTYPTLKFKQVDEAIEKMKKDGIGPVTPSEMEIRLSAAAKRKSGAGLLDPRSALGGGGSSYGMGPGGPGGMGGSGMGNPLGGGNMGSGGRPGMGGSPSGPPPGGMPPPGGGGSSEGGLMPGGMPGRPGMGGRPGGMGSGSEGGMGTGMPMSAHLDTDYLVLRFLDIDVAPGFTYQYRVRLKLKNPNYKRPVGGGNGVVSKQAAGVETIEGRWAAIQETITLPSEKVLYAIDPQKYSEDFKKFYDDHKRELPLKRLAEIDQFEAGRRAVIQVQQWQPTVRMDGTQKREPIGTWVVTDLPVAPGEFVGRRALVELPLWSAGMASYVLRELAGGVKVSGIQNPANQPKGWPINFRTPDVLVDFDGGRQVQKVGDRNVVDDAAQELLIVQPDGKLVVRNSAEDMKDKGREDRNKLWDKWLEDVRNRRVAPTAGMPGAPGGSGGSQGGNFGRP